MWFLEMFNFRANYSNDAELPKNVEKRRRREKELSEMQQQQKHKKKLFNFMFGIGKN